MFTIKIHNGLDINAIAAREYAKRMTDQGYTLWYVPLEGAAVWEGVELYELQTAYVENAAGKTIDKVEGLPSRIADTPPSQLQHATVANDAARLGVFTQRMQGIDPANEAA